MTVRAVLFDLDGTLVDTEELILASARHATQTVLGEALSDILQVGYFKWTKRRTGQGKRIFKMAPLHHHFELLGWSEMQVVWRFFIIGILAGMFGVALALL